MSIASGQIAIQSPQKEGWVAKQSRHLRRWKRRWLVLENSTLYTFKQEREYRDPTEVIDLRVFSSVKSSEDYTNKPNSFDVYSTDMVFSMVADTESEKEDWIRAVGKAIVLSHTKSLQEEMPPSGSDDEEDRE